MKYRLLLLLSFFMMPGMYGCTKHRLEWSQALQEDESFLKEYYESASDQERILLKALFDGNPEHVKNVIKEKNIDVNSLADGKTTFLHAAADVGTFEGNKKDAMVSILIEAGADINKVDEKGRTPLMFSTLVRNTPFGKALVKEGANCRLADSAGKTVLHHAAESVCPWRWELVEKLLPKEPKRDAIVDLNVTDNNGMTPLGYTKKNVDGPDRDKIIHRLESKGGI